VVAPANTPTKFQIWVQGTPMITMPPGPQVITDALVADCTR